MTKLSHITFIPKHSSVRLVVYTIFAFQKGGPKIALKKAPCNDHLTLTEQIECNDHRVSDTTDAYRVADRIMFIQVMPWDRI